MQTEGGLLQRKRLVFPFLPLVLAAACGGGGTPQPPKPTYDPIFKMTVVAQYVMDARLDGVHTEEVRITVGAPEAWGDYTRDHTPSCEPPPDPAQDYVIPMFVTVTNISPADAAPADLNFAMMLAIDDAEITGQFGTELDTAGGCSDAVPARNVTEQGPPGAKVAAIGVKGTKTYPSNTEFNWTTAIVVSGGGAKPLPAARLFLRLTPFGYPPGTLYNITRLMATNSVGGVIAEGGEKGAFFVPLVPNTSPCTTIGRSVKMVCGTDLTPPK